MLEAVFGQLILLGDATASELARALGTDEDAVCVVTSALVRAGRIGFANENPRTGAPTPTWFAIRNGAG